MSVVLVTDIEAALRKTPAITTDDGEMQRLINEAEAEYAEWVLGLPGLSPIAGTTVTAERFDGGRDSLYLPLHTTAVTAAAYTDGTTIDVDDLVLNTRTGHLSWGYNTAGWFTWGTRNLSLSFTLGSLPANHKGAIIDDVAGYFAVTHRSNSATDFPGEEGYESLFGSTPLVRFPRIRALAGPSIA